jgi:hypothetical protein
MKTKYQPLIDHVTAQTEGAVTLSFAAIEAIVGGRISETMQVDTALWKSGRYAIVWRLNDLGWRATLDRRNRCVIFTRDVEQASDETPRDDPSEH